MTPTYDANNIFAKILRGEAPCTKVYEDDVSLAFLDVMPRADGHTLVIPKVAGPQPFRHRPRRSRPLHRRRCRRWPMRSRPAWGPEAS